MAALLVTQPSYSHDTLFSRGKTDVAPMNERTLGGMFYERCAEIHDLDSAVALQQLIELLGDGLKQSNKKVQKLIKSQLQHWIAGLPNYIKACYLPISMCEG